MDKFVLIAEGSKDSQRKSVVKLTPDCYEKVYDLKCKTGISMRKILEQCVDFALEHLDDSPYVEEVQ